MTSETPDALLERSSSPLLEDTGQADRQTGHTRMISVGELPGYQQICGVCEPLVNRISSIPDANAPWSDPDGSEIKHHPNLATLRSSARAGCHLCSHLARSLYEGQVDSALMSYTMRLEMPTPKNHHAFLVVIELANGFFQKLTIYFEPLFFRSDKPMLCQSLLNLRTDHPRVLALAKEWLDTCCTEHVKCQESSASQPFKDLDKDGASDVRFLPRRLIQVQSVGNSVTQVRLVQKSSIDTQDGYLTLSHCWGGADIVKLKTHTLKLFETEIPLADLPKSFKDALFVTVRLGFRYIWIDSLCIIQDSDEDWKLESAQMGRIYWHSECTIAAVKAHDSHEGLFSERYPSSFADYHLPRFHDGNSVVPLCARSSEKAPEPLYTRAWAVQERCLSRRTIHFAAGMISWECLTHFATERCPTGVAEDAESGASHIDNGSEFKDTIGYLLRDSSQCESEKPDKWLDCWWNILQYYTRCDLTFPKDRFEAIRGLVDLVQDARNLAMVGGLWVPFLITELLWQAEEPQKERYPISSPSWSWIGIPGRVFTNVYQDFEAAEVEATATVLNRSVARHWHSTPTTLDYSPLRIQVTARLVPIVCLDPQRSEYYNKTFYTFYFPDRGPIPTAYERSNWDWRWDPDLLPNSAWNLWALQVILDSPDPLNSSDSSDSGYSLEPIRRHGAGLIILPVDGEKDLFQRVGSYDIVWYVEAPGEFEHPEGEGSSPYDEGTIQREFGEMRTIQLI